MSKKYNSERFFVYDDRLYHERYVPDYLFNEKAIFIFHYRNYPCKCLSRFTVNKIYKSLSKVIL
jgi:hypothetical protein